MTIVLDPWWGFVSKKKQPKPQPAPVVQPVTYSDSPCCMKCGFLTIPSGNCHVCPNCGTSQGCS